MKKLTTYKSILTFLLQIVGVYRGKTQAAVRKQQQGRPKSLGAACLAGGLGLIAAEGVDPGSAHRTPVSSVALQHRHRALIESAPVGALLCQHSCRILKHTASHVGPYVLSKFQVV